MSTVQSILNNLGFEMDETAGTNVYAIVNLAIRTIAKRLYQLNSDLAVGALSVSIYAEDTVTGTDIAFNDADPDTITSTTTDLSVFNSGSYLTVTGESDNNGTYQISSDTAPVTATLTLESDEELSDEAAGDSVTLTSIDDYADLPSDFWGLRPDRKTGKNEIYISGKTSLLDPSPGLSTEIQYTTAGEPQWFRIIDDKLWVFPPTSSDITVAGYYFQMPTAVSAASSVIPYNELFDDAITAAVKRWRTGSLDVNAIKALTAIIWDMVDSIVSKREGHAPPKLPQGVSWECY